MNEIDYEKLTITGANAILSELEKIPLYDTNGGRQRTGKENETIIKLRLFLGLNV